MEKDSAKKQVSALQETINVLKKQKQESDAAGNIDLSTMAQEKEALTKEVKALKSSLEKLAAEIESEKTKYRELFLSAESTKAELSRVCELAKENLNKKEENSTTRSPEADHINADHINADHINADQTNGDVVHVVGDVQSICFSEAIQPGSCQRGKDGSKRCKFSHDIKCHKKFYEFSALP